MKEIEIEINEEYCAKYEEEQVNASLRKLYLNKTYLEFLETAPDDQEICVGTKAGGGWLWIDNVKFLQDNINKEEAILVKNTEDVLFKSKKRLHDLPFEMVDYIRRLDDDSLWKDPERKEMAEHTLRSKQKEFATHSNNLTIYTHHQKYWKYVGERKIKDIYKRTSDGKEICIILEGLESGDRWYKDDKEATGRWDID